VTFLPKELALKLPGWLLSGGMGAGAAIAYVLAEREPKALIETFQHWGMWSMLGLVAMVLASRAGDRLMDLGERAIQAVTNSAASQQQLADAVNTIAKKDDERAREMELVVDHLARNSRRALDDLREIKEQLANSGGKERASAHTAGG
jgi:hypothetical protein